MFLDFIRLRISGPVNFNEQECVRVSYNPESAPQGVMIFLLVIWMDCEMFTLMVKPHVKDDVEEYLNVDFMEIKEVQLEKDIKNN